MDISNGGGIDPVDAERVLRAHPDYKVLRRLRIETGPTGIQSAKGWTAAIVDVEATGLDRETAAIVELAIRRIRFAPDGGVTEIGLPFSWLEEPPEPLDPVVSRLTGLTDEVLVGQRIDDGMAVGLLKSVDVVLAHNASYDRKLVERRLPDAAGLAWGCSCSEVDWAARGFDGRSLGFLLWQSGHFSEAHRAIADVDALIALLRDQRGSDRPVLAELIVRASTPGWIVGARGAAFETRHALKARGYRWNVVAKMWEREIEAGMRDGEEFWLARNVYSAGLGATALGPDWREIDWRSRHS